MTFDPHITVASVVEADGNYLMVEELSGGNVVFNQPAGHVEANETLAAAAIRETLEETGWDIEIRHAIGLYVYNAPNGATYYRVCFAARALQQRANAVLDSGIIAAHWLSQEALRERQAAMRSPLVLKCIDDYQRGQQMPSGCLYEHTELAI